MASEDAQQHELLATFLAVTDCEDAAAALSILEATDWQLEQAVNLFLASGAPPSQQGPRGPHKPPGRSSSMDIDSYNLADDVRAPLPTKVERLFGEVDPRAQRAHALRAAQSSHNAAAGAASTGTLPGPAPQGHMLDVFRDFKAEGQAARGGPAGITASGPSPPPAGLSDLFAPPADLMLHDSFDAAKAAAERDGRWLLVNLQSPSEFASHQLNRDTWSQPDLKDVLIGMFVFFQAVVTSQEGQRLQAAYRLQPSQLPITFVVDPQTGARMWHRTGFVCAEKLMEDLVPFMDLGPNDAGAGMLAQSSHQRRVVAQNPVTVTPTAQGSAGLSEDDEMALAIAMSMAQEEGASTMPTSMQTPAPQVGQESVAAAPRSPQAPLPQAGAALPTPQPSESKTSEQVLAEAALLVPPEPPADQPGVCRVALRMPNGTRSQRRFLRTDTLCSLTAYCTTLMPEAAASGARFVLLPGLPGAQALTDMTCSLEQAGLADATANVRVVEP